MKKGSSASELPTSNFQLPTHIAIIMDGNGRWAAANKKAIREGHKKGAEIAKETVKSCLNKKIKFLTLYAFSSENWARPEEEVKDLINLLRLYLADDAEALIKKNIRLKFIGDIKAFPEDVQKKCSELEKKSSLNPELTVSIALNYGSKQEIANALQIIKKKNEVSTIENIGKYLYTAELPDPDLLIRTGGDHRLSNFLLWQSAYTELYFCDTFWPDFNETELDKAIEEFSRRERRFGTRK